MYLHTKMKFIGDPAFKR